MNLRNLSNDQLHQSNIKTAERERKAGVEMIDHLVETKRRRLYSTYDCASLHDYCVKKLKMTNGDAWRKIGSANLIVEAPELGLKLEQGSLTPTHLAEASAFFKRENSTTEEKVEALKAIENTSTEEAKTRLLLRSKSPEIHLTDRMKPKTAKLTQVTVYLDQEAMAALLRLKEIWSHAIPQGELSKIIKRAAAEAVEHNDPMKKAERAKERAEKKTESISVDVEQKEFARQHAPSADTDNTRPEKSPVPGFSKAWVEHLVRLRDQGRCTHVDPMTGRCCESKHYLEFDHVKPKAMGGDYTVENLRLRCRAHNLQHAFQTYGESKMRRFVRADRVRYRA